MQGSLTQHRNFRKQLFQKVFYTFECYCDDAGEGFTQLRYRKGCSRLEVRNSSQTWGANPSFRSKSLAGVHSNLFSTHSPHPHCLLVWLRCFLFICSANDSHKVCRDFTAWETTTVLWSWDEADKILLQENFHCITNKLSLLCPEYSSSPIISSLVITYLSTVTALLQDNT